MRYRSCSAHEEHFWQLSALCNCACCCCSCGAGNAVTAASPWNHAPKPCRHIPWQPAAGLVTVVLTIWSQHNNLSVQPAIFSLNQGHNKLGISALVMVTLQNLKTLVCCAAVCVWPADSRAFLAADIPVRRWQHGWGQARIRANHRSAGSVSHNSSGTAHSH